MSYFEPIWYTSLHAYENNHFVGWNSTTKTVQLYPTKKKFFTQLPEVKKQVDGYQNVLMSTNPVYEVYPTNYTDETQIQQAADQSLFLKQHYLNWREDNILHTLVHNAGILPISFIEIAAKKVWDIPSNSYIFTTVPRVYDGFDIGFDPLYPFDDNPAVFKLIRTTADQVARNPIYKDFKGSTISSLAQDYKEIYYTDKYGMSTFGLSQRLLLAEIQVKDGENIRLVTIDGQGQVLREKVMKNIPFFTIVPFQPSTGSPYQPSLTELELPMNRTMDLVVNRMESMALKYVKGSYLKPWNTKVSLDDEDGTVMSYRGAIAPTPLTSPSVPEWAFQFVGTVQAFADRYGINPMTLGGIPKGSNFRSGKMMDKTNQNVGLQMKTDHDNFAYTLKRSAEVMIFLESRLMVEPRGYTVRSQNQEFSTKKFVGEDYYDNFKGDSNVVPLPKSFAKLTVEIEDETKHGIDAKRQTFIEFSKFYGDLKQNAPELVPEALSLFLKTGDMATVMQAAAKQGTLLDNQTINNIRKNNQLGMFENDPEFKKAMAIVANRLKNDPTIGQDMTGKVSPQGGGAKGGSPDSPQGGAPGSPATTAPTPPEQMPNQPKGGKGDK
jgi:hypothetical protein